MNISVKNAMGQRWRYYLKAHKTPGNTGTHSNQLNRFGGIISCTCNKTEKRILCQVFKISDIFLKLLFYNDNACEMISMKPVKTLHTATIRSTKHQQDRLIGWLRDFWFLMKTNSRWCLSGDHRNTMAGGAYWATWLVRRRFGCSGLPYLKTKEPGWMMFTLNRCILSDLLAVTLLSPRGYGGILFPHQCAAS